MEPPAPVTRTVFSLKYFPISILSRTTGSLPRISLESSGK